MGIFDLSVFSFRSRKRVQQSSEVQSPVEDIQQPQTWEKSNVNIQAQEKPNENIEPEKQDVQEPEQKKPIEDVLTQDRHTDEYVTYESPRERHGLKTF